MVDTHFYQWRGSNIKQVFNKNLLRNGQNVLHVFISPEESTIMPLNCGHRIVCCPSVALQLYLPASLTLRFSSVKTCPFKISLFGFRGFSTQLVKVGWCKRVTVAFGLSVEQFITVFIPKKPCTAKGASFRNCSASAPVVNKHWWVEKHGKKLQYNYLGIFTK